MIHTTVYVSTLVEPLGSGEVAGLLEASRVANAHAGVTGLLLMRGRRVMQTLEGDAVQVQRLFDRIRGDERHGAVVQVWSGTHLRRRFPEWSMGFDDLDMASALPASDAGWPEPHFADIAPGGSANEWITRRAEVLRRALVHGDRSLTSLAIILNGHRPESVLGDDSVLRSRCAECRVASADAIDSYPCHTARNAIWALEAALL